ncbi:MAG: glycosyltransferase family 4 protein [Egibacteraceae bacterium]
MIKLLQASLAARDGARALHRSPGEGHEPDEALEGRKHRAVLEDYELAYRAELHKLDFDLVHAHDATTIGCAANAVMAKETGPRSRLVYDAHEYARGLSNLPAAVRDVNVALEQASIGTADAVLTVSPVLARLLQRDHALSQLPGLVLNAPLAAAFDPDSPLSVRASVGLADDVPLAVYAGIAKPLRGVDTVVRALPLLPELHVAVVVNTPHVPVVKALVSEAERSGCAERLHLLPYVDQDQVTNYLRTADVGLYPLLRSGNTELAWPTKIFEYLHAGLPMVVSDMPSMSQLVTEQGWGEVFKADDHESFAAAMQRVLAHPGTYDAGLRDEAVRERFSWERQARTLIDTYDRLLLVDESEGLKRA